jgi:hypothetical protein
VGYGVFSAFPGLGLYAGPLLTPAPSMVLGQVSRLYSRTLCGAVADACAVTLVVVSAPVVVQPAIVVATEPVASEPPPDPGRFIVVKPDNPAPPLAQVEKKPSDKKPAEKPEAGVNLGLPGEFPRARRPAGNLGIEADL